MPSVIAWRCAPVSTHSHGRPVTQRRQVPHGAFHDSTTRSPGASPSTPSPTDATSAAPSWPITVRRSSGQSPSRVCRSEWQTPAASMRTSISPGAGRIDDQLLDADPVGRVLEHGGSHSGGG